MPRIDPRELPLLADIERELKRDPPAEVHALLAEYRRGADRATLIDHVQSRFPKDLPLRVLALRWIDKVRPGPAGPQGEKPRAPAPGSGAGWVAPIRPKAP
jgi:hypothetical protein